MPVPLLRLRPTITADTTARLGHDASLGYPFLRGNHLVAIFAFWPDCLLLGLAVGCKAQNTPPAARPDPALNRRIEILVRSEYDMPR